MSSKIANDTYNTLKEIFPYNRIIKEHYIYYKNTRLFFDFYIPELLLLFECQGIQHLKYIKHFHGSVENFRSQKKRDNLKVEYVEGNLLTLVLLYDKIDKITVDLVLERIIEAQNKED